MRNLKLENYADEQRDHERTLAERLADEEEEYRNRRERHIDGNGRCD